MCSAASKASIKMNQSIVLHAHNFVFIETAPCSLNLKNAAAYSGEAEIKTAASCRPMLETDDQKLTQQIQ